MIIYPAIDIYNGKGVRLKKGDFNHVTEYGTPQMLCQSWVDAGAKYLHVVDLNGARQQKDNFEVIKQLVSSFDLKIQTGGGIRSKKQVEELINLGVDRIVLGTAAVKNPRMLRSIVETYKERIVVGVDANNGRVAIEGWEELSDIRSENFVKVLETMGVKRVVYTDISKDGMMSGPNFKAYENLVKNTSMEIIASGGVTTTEDIRKLKAIGVYGVILGKTLYEKHISLEEALLC